MHQAAKTKIKVESFKNKINVICWKFSEKIKKYEV